MKLKLPRRSRSHVLETESEKALLNALPNEWVVEKTSSDYGVDYSVEVYEDGTTTGIELSIQLKAHKRFSTRCRLMKQRLAVSTLNYLLLQDRTPVLMVYESETKRLRFLFVNYFVEDILAYCRPKWRMQETTTLYVPLENQLRSVFDHSLRRPYPWECFPELVKKIHGDRTYSSRFRKSQELMILARVDSSRAAERERRYFFEEDDPEILIQIITTSQNLPSCEPPVASRLAGLLGCGYFELVVRSWMKLAESPPAFPRKALLRAYKSFWSRDDQDSLGWGWEDTKSYLCTLVYVAGEVASGDDKELAGLLLYEFNDPLRNWIGQAAGKGLIKMLERATPEIRAFIRASILEHKDRYHKTFRNTDSTKRIIKHVIDHDYRHSFK